MTINEGDMAPDFSLPTDGDGRVALADCRGRKLVLYFYPRDNTTGCTREAWAFRDAHPEFEAAGATIVGVSPDKPGSHDRFRGKHGLPFRLASDTDHAVAMQFGVWVEKQMYGRKFMGLERSTFLIDGEGRVARVWRKVKVNGHAQEVLEAAQGLADAGPR